MNENLETNMPGRKELLQWLTCPIDWSEICAEPELLNWLQFAWFATLKRYQQYDELIMLFSSYDYSLERESIQDDPDDDYWHMVANRVGLWIDDARLDYERSFQGLARMGPANAGTYAKHYARKKAEGRSAGSEKISKLSQVMTAELQTRLFWAALNEIVFVKMAHFNELEIFSEPKAAEEALRATLVQPGLKIVFDCRRITGVAYKQETTFALIDIDFSTPQFHVYPISAVEYLEAEHKAYIQGWNYGL